MKRDRRAFLSQLAGAGIGFGLGLPGCGGAGDGRFSSSASSGALTAVPSDSGLSVSGTISSELSPLQSGSVASSYGPSRLEESGFSTVISSDSVSLLVLEDSERKVRALTLTLPGQPPHFSAETTALALVFLTPGFIRIAPEDALRRAELVRGSSAFPALVNFLRQRASLGLEAFTSQPEFIAHRDGVVSALGSPYPRQQSALVSGSGKDRELRNPSSRFVGVSSSDPGGGHLLMRPFENNKSPFASGISQPVLVYGPGSPPLPPDAQPFLDTFGPTLYYHLVHSALELAAGKLLDPLVLWQSSTALRRTINGSGFRQLMGSGLAAPLASGSLPLGLVGMASSITLAATQVTQVLEPTLHLPGFEQCVKALIRMKLNQDVADGLGHALVHLVGALSVLPAVSEPLNG